MPLHGGYGLKGVKYEEYFRLQLKREANGNHLEISEP